MFEKNSVEKTKTHISCPVMFVRKSWSWWNNVERYERTRQVEDYNIQGGSNMTGADLCVNKCKQSRSYLNHLVIRRISLRGWLIKVEYFKFCRTCISIYLCDKTNLMHYLSSISFVNQHLHVSGIFVAHYQEVYCVYIQKFGACCAFQLTVCWPAERPANRQSTEKHNTHQIFVYIHSIPPDNGLKLCPKHVDVDWRKKLRINIASSWFLLHKARKEQHTLDI